MAVGDEFEVVRIGLFRLGHYSQSAILATMAEDVDRMLSAHRSSRQGGHAPAPWQDQATRKDRGQGHGALQLRRNADKAQVAHGQDERSVRRCHRQEERVRALTGEEGRWQRVAGLLVQAADMVVGRASTTSEIPLLDPLRDEEKKERDELVASWDEVRRMTSDDTSSSETTTKK